MDKGKTNTEDSSVVESGSSTSDRNSLVAYHNIAKRTRKSGDDKLEKQSKESSSDRDSDISSCRKKLKKMKKSKKKKKHSKKRKKEKNYDSSCSVTLENDSDEKKRLKRKHKDKNNESLLSKKVTQESEVGDDSNQFGPTLPDELIVRSKAMAPMSKQEWEQQQRTIKRVYDEDSGRYRLIRGGGEIVEECVSRERHRQINKQATAADGLFFQKYLSKK